MNFVSTIIFVGVKILLGDVIKNRRSAKGWTQGAFAKKLAVSIGYISEIETGRRMPSLNMLLSMIDLLECTPNEILEYNGREEQDVKEKAEPYLCSSGTDETIASIDRPHDADDDAGGAVQGFYLREGSEVSFGLFPQLRKAARRAVTARRPRGFLDPAQNARKRGAFRLPDFFVFAARYFASRQCAMR